MKRIIFLILSLLMISSAFAITGSYSRWDFENNMLDTGNQGWDITNEQIVGYTTGKVGSAIITNETTVLYYDATYPYTDDFYLGCWVKRYSPAITNDFYFCFGSSGQYPYSCLANAAALGNTLIYSNAGNQDFLTGYEMPLDEWIHIAMYRNVTEGQMHVLVNGSQVYQGSYSVGGDEDITIAYNFNGVEALDGEIDNCYFLDHIPDETEKVEILSTALPCEPDWVCNWYDCNGESAECTDPLDQNACGVAYEGEVDTYCPYLSNYSVTAVTPTSFEFCWDINTTLDLLFVNPMIDRITPTAYPYVFETQIHSHEFGDVSQFCTVISSDNFVEYVPGDYVIGIDNLEAGTESETIWEGNDFNLQIANFTMPLYEEPTIVVEGKERKNNAAFIIAQQNLAKQSGSEKPANLFQAIAQVIHNIRKALGLE